MPQHGHPVQAGSWRAAPRTRTRPSRGRRRVGCAGAQLMLAGGAAGRETEPFIARRRAGGRFSAQPTQTRPCTFTTAPADFAIVATVCSPSTYSSISFLQGGTMLRPHSRQVQVSEFISWSSLSAGSRFFAMAPARIGSRASGTPRACWSCFRRPNSCHAVPSTRGGALPLQPATCSV